MQRLGSVVVLFALLCCGCAAPLPPPSSLLVKLVPIATGLVHPVQVVDDGTGRLFIVEQGGRILIEKNGTLLATPFLDLRGNVSGGAEQGLLSMAFHPRFSQNGRFFVDYTDPAGDSIIAEYHVDPTRPEEANASSARVLLKVDQPFSNHNGGLVLFGPDGYVYIGFGDGGSGGDPRGNAQNLDVLLGKILRIDVDGAEPYAVPASNPFHGPGQRGEIWDYGLRNPWRFTFDQATGDLWIGDVGQNSWEEVDHEPKGAGGKNYGWNVYEGNHPYRGGSAPGAVGPGYEYATGTQGSCAVTGGYVYRGHEVPGLGGAYVFGDFCDGIIWTLRQTQGEWRAETLLRTGRQISSFGQDASGEIFVVDHGGIVSRLVAA